MSTQNTFCPRCHTELSVQQELWNQNISCPVCNNIFIAENSEHESKPASLQLENLCNCWRRELDDFFARRAKRRGIFYILDILLDIIDFKWLFYIFVAIFSRKDKIWDVFQKTQFTDQKYLNTLDILPRYGKTSSQLTAPEQTLFSPVLDDNEPDAKYEFVDEQSEDDNTLVYSLEQVTKVYTFEHQLFVFQAYWDYTNGTFFNESTETFFFKDITDISTNTEYDDIKIPIEYDNVKIPERKGLLHFFKTNQIHVFVTIPVCIYLLALIGGHSALLTGTPWGALLALTPLLFFVRKINRIVLLLSLIFLVGVGKVSCVIEHKMWFYSLLIVAGYYLIVWIINCIDSILSFFKKLFCRTSRTVKVKQAETFTITASSGRSIGMTILCDEWIEANNGKYTGRTDGEKIIQAIRKMIEEKKVSANE